METPATRQTCQWEDDRCRMQQRVFGWYLWLGGVRWRRGAERVRAAGLEREIAVNQTYNLLPLISSREHRIHLKICTLVLHSEIDLKY